MASTGIKRNRRRQNASGFTLVELMITLVVASILMAAVYTFFLAQQRSATVQQDLAIIQQDLRAAMQILTRDIHMAGYDPSSSDSFGFERNATFNNGLGQSEAVSTTNTTLAFTLDLDGDGTLDRVAEDVDGTGGIDLRELEQVAYRLDPANTNRLQRYSTTTGAAEWIDVAENIQAIEFWYQVAGNIWTLAPTVAQMSEIQSIRVSVLARAVFPDQDFLNNIVYTTASGAVFPGAPYNDNLRRRLLVLTILCRNRGL